VKGAQLALLGELPLEPIDGRSLFGKFVAQRDDLLPASGQLVFGPPLEFDDSPHSSRPRQQRARPGVEFA
jgi:hypothetical protein